MKIVLTGYEGHMGREVRASAERTKDAKIVCGVDPMAPEGDAKCVRSLQECRAEADVIIKNALAALMKG